MQTMLININKCCTQTFENVHVYAYMYILMHVCYRFVSVFNISFPNAQWLYLCGERGQKCFY